MWREDFSTIYKQEFRKLLRFFRNKLKERGCWINLDVEARQLLQKAVEAAYRNSKKEQLSGYTVKKLIWLKAKNEWYHFLYPPQKDAPYDALDGTYAPRDPDPDACDRLETQEQLDQIEFLIGPTAVEIFRRLAERTSYQELAVEFNTTGPALKQQVYRWRKEIQRRLKRWK